MSARKRPNFLEREERLRKSGVRDVFTPHLPVREDRYLRGREEQVEKLVAQHNTPGRHGVIFGPRGVGKSSVAEGVGRLLKHASMTTDVFVYRCDSRTTFEDLLSRPFVKAGVDLDISESERLAQETEGIDAGFSIFRGRRDKTETKRELRKRVSAITPERAASFFAERKVKGFLIVDEADAAPLRPLFHLAEFIKQLSDLRSGLKVLVVGIAKTASDLTGSHPSVERCLMEIGLGPVSDSALAEIVEVGGTEIGIRFEQRVIDRVVEVSRGYPHFTHLLALKCAEIAFIDELQDVTPDTLSQALSTAYTEAEGKLRTSYSNSVRSASPMYRQTLIAGAHLVGDNHSEFTARDLRAQLSNLRGEEVTQGELNNYLRRLVSDEGSSILTRAAKGVYYFSDPRMPSFVLIANQLP